MAWLALVAQGAGAGVNAQGTKQAAQAQADQLTTQSNQDYTSADQAQAAGYQAAQRIRTQGRSTVGQANSALAASGVDVGQGTAEDVRTKITQNAEQDAMNTILSADSRATNLRTQAGFESEGAADALKAGQVGLVKGALSALAGGAKTASNWKTSAGSSSADTSFDNVSDYG